MRGEGRKRVVDDGDGMEGERKEEDLEGVIPQDPPVILLVFG